MVRHWYDYEILTQRASLVNMLESGLLLKEMCEFVGCSMKSLHSAFYAHDIDYVMYPQFENIKKARGRCRGRPKK